MVKFRKMPLKVITLKTRDALIINLSFFNPLNHIHKPRNLVSRKS